MMATCGKITTEEKVDKECEDLMDYLEKGGVLDALTNVFGDIKRMKKRPDEPLDFVIMRLGGFYSKPTPMHENIIKELMIKIMSLERENKIYKEHIEDIEQNVEGLLAELNEHEDNKEDGENDADYDDEENGFSTERRTESTPSPLSSPEVTVDNVVV